jgi:hypothetical protein
MKIVRPLLGLSLRKKRLRSNQVHPWMKFTFVESGFACEAWKVFIGPR